MSSGKKNKSKEKTVEEEPAVILPAPPTLFQIENFNDEQLQILIEQKEETDFFRKEEISKIGKKQGKFNIYSNELSAPKNPTVIYKPTLTEDVMNYLMTACETHAMKALEIIIGEDSKQTFIMRLFLYNVIRDGLRLKVSPPRMLYIFDIFFDGIKMFFDYRNTSQMTIENYFEERLIKHSVERPGCSKQIFSLEEAKGFTKLFARFIRLMPLLHIYYYRPFNLRLDLIEYQPLDNRDCKSHTEIKFQNENLPRNNIMRDTRPKIFPNKENLSSCKLRKSRSTCNFASKVSLSTHIVE